MGFPPFPILESADFLLNTGTLEAFLNVSACPNYKFVSLVFPWASSISLSSTLQLNFSTVSVISALIHLPFVFPVSPKILTKIKTSPPKTCECLTHQPIHRVEDCFYLPSKHSKHSLTKIFQVVHCICLANAPKRKGFTIFCNWIVFGSSNFESKTLI